MKKEAPENEASYFSHGLREAVFQIPCEQNEVSRPRRQPSCMFGPPNEQSKHAKATSKKWQRCGERRDVKLVGCDGPGWAVVRAGRSQEPDRPLINAETRICRRSW